MNSVSGYRLKVAARVLAAVVGAVGWGAGTALATVTATGDVEPANPPPGPVRRLPISAIRPMGA